MGPMPFTRCRAAIADGDGEKQRWLTTRPSSSATSDRLSALGLAQGAQRSAVRCDRYGGIEECGLPAGTPQWPRDRRPFPVE